MKKFATTAIISLMAILVITTSGVNPSFADNHTVTICHRTNSASNPYVQITVADSAADEDTGNDNGQGDHAAEHQGPVPEDEQEAQALKDAHVEWGDIIPPHDNFPGLNWTSEGQAIYNNGCNYTSVTPTPSTSSGPTVTPTEEPSGTVTPTPTSELTPTQTITPTGQPSITPSPTNPCTGASCNTGGTSPTPSTSSGPTATPTEVTPTVTVTATPVATATPTTPAGTTATPTPSTSSGPTASAPVGGTTTSAAQPTNAPAAQGAVPAERVLGAAAMAKTGIFETIAMTLLGVLGALLMGVGYLFHKKEASA